MKQLHKETSEKFNSGAFIFKHLSLSNNKSAAIYNGTGSINQYVTKEYRCTRRIDYVTQWERTCHERMDIEKRIQKSLAWIFIRYI